MVKRNTLYFFNFSSNLFKKSDKIFSDFFLFLHNILCKVIYFLDALFAINFDLK
jgi:hypothetical protein